MYAFIAPAAFIVQEQMNRDTSNAGFLLATLVAGLWLGSMLASRLAGRVPASQLFIFANVFSTVMAAFLVVASFSGVLTISLIAVLMALFTIGVGIVAPVALAQEIDMHPTAAGTAAGVYDFIQMASRACFTLLAGIGSDHALTSTPLLVAGGSVAYFSFACARSKVGAR